MRVIRFAARVIRLRSREELRSHAVGGSGLDLDAYSALLTSLNSISVRRRTGAEIPIRWPPISQIKVRKDKDVQEIICFTPIANKVSHILQIWRKPWMSLK